MNINMAKKYITEVVADHIVLLDKKAKLHPDETGDTPEELISKLIFQICKI